MGFFDNINEIVDPDEVDSRFIDKDPDWTTTAGHVFAEARDRLPINSFMKMNEIKQAGGLINKYQAELIQDGTLDTHGREYLTAEEYKNSDVYHPDIDLPNGGYYSAIKILKERKELELARNNVIARGPKGILPTIGNLAVSIAAEGTDPLNVALMAIPIVSDARVLSWVGKSKFFRRTVKGGLEGLVGGIPAEAITYTAYKQEQHNYTVEDAMFNLAIGGVAGAGLHNLFGGAKDLFKYKSLADRQELIEKALSDVASDKVVNTQGISDKQTLTGLSPDELKSSFKESYRNKKEALALRKVSVIERPYFDQAESIKYGLFDEQGIEITDPALRAAGIEKALQEPKYKPMAPEDITRKSFQKIFDDANFKDISNDEFIDIENGIAQAQEWADSNNLIYNGIDRPGIDPENINQYDHIFTTAWGLDTEPTFYVRPGENADIKLKEKLDEFGISQEEVFRKQVKSDTYELPTAKVASEVITDTNIELTTNNNSVAQLSKKTPESARDLTNYPNVDLTDAEAGNFWEFNRIIVGVGNEGIGEGTKLMKRLVYIADEKGMTIYNTPNAYGGLSQLELVNWYRKHGFEIIKEEGRLSVMIRRPRKMRPSIDHIQAKKLDILKDRQVKFNEEKAKYDVEIDDATIEKVRQQRILEAKDHPEALAALEDKELFKTRFVEGQKQLAVLNKKIKKIKELTVSDKEVIEIFKLKGGMDAEVKLFNGKLTGKVIDNLWETHGKVLDAVVDDPRALTATTKIALWNAEIERIKDVMRVIHQEDLLTPEARADIDVLNAKLEKEATKAVADKTTEVENSLYKEATDNPADQTISNQPTILRNKTKILTKNMEDSNTVMDEVTDMLRKIDPKHSLADSTHPDMGKIRMWFDEMRVLTDRYNEKLEMVKPCIIGG